MEVSMEIEQHREGLFFKLDGAIDSYTTASFKQKILNKVKNNHKIFLDFSQVKSIDSAGLGQIVSIVKACRQKNVFVCLINVNNDIETLLNITGISSLVEVK